MPNIFFLPFLLFTVSKKQKLIIEHKWIKNGRGIIYQIPKPDQVIKEGASVRTEDNQYYPASSRNSAIIDNNCRFKR
jgi:hypothetical protein